MSRKKILEQLEEVRLPRTLIIGKSNIEGLLIERLKNYGCQVKKISIQDENIDETIAYLETEKSTLGKFNYIFHFSHFSLAEKIKTDFLETQGKYLFIETQKKEDLTASPKISIIRIGSEINWGTQELVDKLLRTLFMDNEDKIIDVRKKSIIPEKDRAKVEEERIINYPALEKNKPEIPEGSKGPAKEKKQADYLVVRKNPLIAKLLIFFVIILLLVSVGGISGFLFWHYYALRDTFDKLQYHLSSSNLDEASLDIAEAKKKLVLFHNLYKYSNSSFLPFGKISYYNQAGKLLDSSKKLLDTTGDLLENSRTISVKNFGLLGGGESITAEELDSLNQKILSLKQELVSTRSEMERINLPFFPKDNIDFYFSLSIEKLQSAGDLIPLLEKLFVTQGTKVYLVLLQNNMELRPTGGFIGSFALVTVGKGKIIDFKIEDVYTADGQLKGHVDPPEPIRKYLAQPHFFLRDSNFDPDFAVSAEKANFFLQKELGVSADGVIGINLYPVQKILQIIGPVTLTDFGNEVITADNFFFKAQEYTQKDFFPGSTAKKDFLSSVTKAIFTSVTFDKKISWFKLLPEIKKALEQKNIMIYTRDEEINRTLGKLGYFGQMAQVKCFNGAGNNSDNNITPEDNCVSDYLAVIEANLGVNKANYFIEKSVIIEKKIDETGELNTEVTLSYENQSLPELNPDLSYVNYLRLFVPLESKLLGVTFNNTPVLNSEIDVEKYETDKTSIGVLIRIAPGNKGVVKFIYSHPAKITDTHSSYQFYFQKQAGDKTSPLVLSIRQPNNLILSPQNFKSTTLRNNEIFYTTDTSVDRIFAINIKH